VLFPHLRDIILGEPLGYADKGGPETAMNQSYFPFDQAAYENIA